MPNDRNPPGRPPVVRGEPSVSVHVTVSGSQYDRLEQRAAAARVNVPELIRRRLADDDEGDE
jgi:hypothetical protein